MDSILKLLADTTEENRAKIIGAIKNDRSMSEEAKEEIAAIYREDGSVKKS